MMKHQGVSSNFKGSLYAVTLLLSIFSSLTNASLHSRTNSRNLISRQLSWGGRRIELAFDLNNQQHRRLHKASFQIGSFGRPDPLLLLRGGAAEEATKKKKKSKKEEEDEDWDELVKSETIEEKEDTKDEDQIDDDDETEDEIDDEEEEEEEDADLGSEVEESKGFDEPLMPSPMLQLYATFGVMMFSRKVDLYNPFVVRMARFAFIGYLVILQLFLLFVRTRAKTVDDRTPVTTTNPLNGLLQSQLGGGDNGNAMIKNLASTFLSSQSTVLEYDLGQAKSMQGGLLFNMAFMWLLHFKFQQMQPLMINTVTGLLNMVYSPLFQVYVLGRNLERPFKNPGMEKYQNAMDAQAEAQAQAEDVVEAVKAETTIDDEEEEASPSSDDEEASEEDEPGKDENDDD